MSRLPFELFLALRYLRPKRTFVSVITLISVIGVMLGVAVLIIVISVMTGFDQQLREKILGFSAHLKVMKYDDALEGYPDLMREISSNQNVTAVAPFILGQVMIKTQPSVGKSRVAAPWIRGVDPTLESRISSLPTNIISGEFDLEGDGILLGSELAHSLKVSVGDRIAIYSPRNLEEMEKHRGKEDEVIIPPDEFVVRGIFDLGYYEYDANVIITSLRNAQSLYELRGKAHGLFVMLRDPYLAMPVGGQLRVRLGPDYRLTSWMDDNSKILTALIVEKKVMFLLLNLVMTVAAFCIMNSQITFVVQKTREIGILKALGASRAQIMSLFFGQSCIIAIVGVAWGLGMGLLGVKFRNEFLDLMNRSTGLELFPREIYSFSRLPAVIDAGDITLICGTAFVICVLAGLLPARFAGSLRPVEALRHE